uniref:G-protein coupled receptors family 1 profile domain-containing protein n=1 Tax=Anabas testudineus TaxID=64144 RepID=A0A3Q1IUR0_ANATE
LKSVFTDYSDTMSSLSEPEYNESYEDYYIGELIGLCTHNNNHSVEQVVGPYVHSIICILGFMGNSLVIATYAFYKRTKSMTDIYLLNVAIADLLFVVALPLILLRGSYSVNLYSGMLLLACISTDRYIAIVQARRSFRLRSLSYSRIICAIVWVCAVLLSVPTFYFYHCYQPSHNMMFVFSDNNTALLTKLAVPSTQIAVGFFLPLLIMIFCYTAVIITLLRAKNFQRHKAVRVVLAVVVVFIVCHLPYNVTLLYDTISMFDQHSCEESDALHTAKTVTQTIAYMHCCLNPVLYAFVGVKFRNHFRKIVQDLWCLGKRYIAHAASPESPLRSMCPLADQWTDPVRTAPLSPCEDCCCGPETSILPPNIRGS